MGTDREGQGQVDAPLAAVCRSVGLDPRGARLLHVRANATYHLPDTDAVVRMRCTRGTAAWEDRLASSMQVTAWLADQGFHTVRPLPLPSVTVGGWTATFWEYLPIEPKQATSDQLAELLRALHSFPDPPVDLVCTDPLGSLPADLAHAGDVLTEEQRDWLRNRANDIAQLYPKIEMPLGHGLIHGDAHTGNIFRVRNDHLLGDWDSVSRGPRAQDLTPTLGGVLHFGRPRTDWVSLCSIYGADPRIEHHPGMQLLCRAREVRSLAAYIRSAPGRPDIQAELNKRLKTLISGVVAVWRPI